MNVLKLFILILFFTIIHCDCVNKYRKKTTKMIGKDIYAELLFFGQPISQCLNLQTPSPLAILNTAGNISIGDINNNEFINIDNNTHFSFSCKRYYSFPNQLLLWGFGLRNFCIVDINTGVVEDFLLSSNGNERIIQVDIIDYKNPKLYIDIAKSTWGKSIHRGLIFDPLNKNVTDTINNYSGEIFPLPNGDLLFEKFNGSHPPKWQIGNGFNTEFSNNKLTDKLNDSSLIAWAVSYSYQNNFMIGYNTVNHQMIYYSIKWDNTFDNISIEPFTFQKEANQILWHHFEISPDGKWAKSVARQKEPYTKSDTITFFAINDSFPQSLSLPVYGGVSSRNGGGCFVETDDWGTVYVDITPEMPGHLVVYRMRDVMEKVIEKTQKLAQ